jgi:hypothetical protein
MEPVFRLSFLQQQILRQAQKIKILPRRHGESYFPSIATEIDYQKTKNVKVG